jgi:hypothetical protein
LTWDGHATGGRYVISGHRITFTPKNGGSYQTKRKYTFTRRGSGLRFKPIGDACAVRRDVLTYGP